MNVQKDIREVCTVKFFWCYASFHSAGLFISDSVIQSLRTETSIGGDGEKAETFITMFKKAILCQYCSHYQIVFQNTRKKLKIIPFNATKNIRIS